MSVNIIANRLSNSKMVYEKSLSVLGKNADPVLLEVIKSSPL